MVKLFLRVDAATDFTSAMATEPLRLLYAHHTRERERETLYECQHIESDALVERAGVAVFR